MQETETSKPLFGVASILLPSSHIVGNQTAALRFEEALMTTPVQLELTAPKFPGRQCKRPGCGQMFYTRKKSQQFCSPACRYLSLRIPIEQRFWPQLKIADNGCWEWTDRAIDKDGYGQLQWNGEQRAHRVAWIITFGPIPDGKWVLHSCDNRKCCNPFHLFLGDAAANNADMLSKGRQKYLCGEERREAKLTTEQVLEIRRLHAEGMQQRKIAKLFCVGFKAINKIVLRQRWKHIPEAQSNKLPAPAIA